MIKKTAGIATILLLILGIAIGIARANVKSAQLQKDAKHSLSLKNHKDHSLLLSELKVLLLDEKLVEKDLSAAAEKHLVKPDALLNAHLSKVGSVKLADGLGLLELKA